MFGYSVLISIDFLRFYFSVCSLVFVSIEKIYQTLETVFHRLSYTSIFCKNTTLRVIFSTLFSVFGYPDETLSLVFNILLTALNFTVFHVLITKTFVWCASFMKLHFARASVVSIQYHQKFLVDMYEN